MDREVLDVDVLVVGAGPAGLAAACRLMQLAGEAGQELNVCVVEKGSEVGAHILSGAILETRALDELFPDWKDLGAPVQTQVTHDEVYLFRDDQDSIKLPNAFVPRTMHNQGNYVISLGNFCRWLAEQAENLGVDIFPGFNAASLLLDDDNRVAGVVTGDMGVDAEGQAKSSFTPGMELRARYTLFAEGCRGHLGKELLTHYQLDKNSDPQHYGLGIKELWDIDPDKHHPGLVVHGAGWPLQEGTSGGSFLYHAEDNQVVVGLIVDLNYSNPYVSPFDEFQRMKHHPQFKQYLEGGKRVSYGARAITKGGFNSLPKMTFPGGLLLGCDAGTLDFSKIKGTHTAMKSGLLGAESVFSALTQTEEAPAELEDFTERFQASWLYEELFRSRNFGPALHRWGIVLGGAFNYLDQNWFRGRMPLTLRDTRPDYAQLQKASAVEPLTYPKPDGVISFDKLSSVYLSNTHHEEDQPCHLKLQDSELPLQKNWPEFAEPAQRYCPAGVYEVLEEAGKLSFQINAQNCVHCKTCDIKDPSQNITWVTPEAGGGPNYPNM
ncbi:electron transfer flavoprotein-ubiquinone oxidoreductase [Marinospirillum sp.]|uniref:electron transfer flavoprotein-ubiquinone oxidoreductase n=1 Tax=Marinospirillum sp. TaxID=2183934 RepID=UPI00286FC766|nr:electron transfer flavoprotein-ubiquinone oxidoreductase [Marinospirillum sp.]MDR9467875.1 electron transfer flavoprotein-ubiquinone oxidoreductase [Marinospirillum sp.]